MSDPKRFEVMQFRPEEIAKYGTPAAALLSLFRYFTEKNRAAGRNIVDDHVWTYGTIGYWHGYVWWVSERTVKSALKTLVDAGEIVRRQGVRKKNDRTNWYRLGEKTPTESTETKAASPIGQKLPHPSGKGCPFSLRQNRTEVNNSHSHCHSHCQSLENPPNPPAGGFPVSEEEEDRAVPSTEQPPVDSTPETLTEEPSLYMTPKGWDGDIDRLFSELLGELEAVEHPVLKYARPAQLRETFHFCLSEQYDEFLTRNTEPLETLGYHNRYAGLLRHFLLRYGLRTPADGYRVKQDYLEYDYFYTLICQQLNLTTERVPRNPERDKKEHARLRQVIMTVQKEGQASIQTYLAFYKSRYSKWHMPGFLSERTLRSFLHARTGVTPELT